MRHRNAVALCLLLAVAVGACASPAPEQTATTAEARTESSAISGETEPITGYGNFSNVEYWDVDWFEVVTLEAKCLVDHGFPVTTVPPGDGISFDSVAADQIDLALDVFYACQEGLNLPVPVPADQEQIEERYSFLLELRDCVENQGYPTTNPPSLDVFVDSWNDRPWSPYDLVAANDQMGIEEWNALNIACPQS